MRNLLMYSRSSHAKKGGAETVYNTLCNGVEEKGYEIERVYNSYEAGSNTKNKCIQLAPKRWAITLPVLRTYRKIPRPSSLLAVTRSVLQLAVLIRHIRPTVVYCHYIDYCSFYFAFLKPLFGYKLILSGRGSDLLKYESHNALLQLLQPLTLKSADHLIGASQALVNKATDLAPSLAGSTSVIPNGVNKDFFMLQGGANWTQPPVIASVGNLRTVKGHDVLIRALPEVLREIPDVKVCIAGEGPEHEALKHLAAEMGVSDNVELLGWCSTKKVQNLLQDTTLFVMPSRSEGFGLALVEAMAAGLPVVASAVGGMPDIVEDKHSGLLVPPEDSEALSKAITDLLNDRSYAESLAENARERAKAFDWDTAIDQYEETFRVVAQW